jgi:putative nucleotidyltransferase with HDIG domain
MSGVRQLGTRVYIAGLALAASICFVLSMLHPGPAHPAKFLCYLCAALLASLLKVSLPDIEGTMSMNFLLTLICILELGLPETLIIGVAKTLLQFYWKPVRRLKPIQLVFNLSQVTLCCAAAYGNFKLIAIHNFRGAIPLALLAAGITHFVCNTIAMSIIIGLTEQKSIRKVWSEVYLWTFPYYMVGAAIAGFVGFVSGQVGWQASLLVLPPIYLMYRSSQLYLGKLQAEKLHAEKVSHLHLRTIEALALAIEAKDQTTGEHLQRVRIYAMELARELGLNEDETEALQAASVLHDIGKLAVPEHIIAKPGKLTPEEFEKMKIHPIVGAEILEQVDFPYPVVPIVRAHHEKWDGSGYPQGLKGEQIPIGARILSAVDCLDALASDRQYRKALPLDEAMAKVASESGISFDPRVVEVLQRRYVELENLANQQPLQTPPKLSTDIKVERGLAPDAGFAESETGAGGIGDAVRHGGELIAAARKEMEALARLSVKRDGSLAFEDLMSLLAVRVRRFIPHDSMAVYVVREKVLIPEFVSGDNFRLFSSLRIPVGEGLSGWVAENSKAILNGNPSVEPGYLNDPTKYSTLRSALAVPLRGKSNVVAVLALYRVNQDAFARDNLDLLQTMCSSLGAAIENSLPCRNYEGDPRNSLTAAAKAGQP